MSLVPAELEAAVRSGHATAVRDLLRGATEAERAACAKALKKFLTGPQWHMPRPVMLQPQEFMQFMASGYQDMPAALAEQEREQRVTNADYDAWREIRDSLAFQVAAFGLAGGAAASAQLAGDFHGWHCPQADVDLLADVLADRGPGWLPDFVDRHLRGQYEIGTPAWPLARALVRLGAIARPAAPEYTTRMPGYLLVDDAGRWTGPATAAAVQAALLADPGLLEDEVWRLFTVPDAGKELERDGGTDGWTAGLGRLCADGLLDRGRLIDSCLAAFNRDFNPNRVSWYAAMLHELGPTDEELAARADVYCGLLAANSKDGIRVGQEGLRRLLAAGRVDPGRLLQASGPALLFKRKQMAIAQLKLIEMAATSQPGCAAQAAATAATAFGHERQDVQEAALALVQKLGILVGEPLAEIRRHAADLSLSLQPAATALGLLADPDAPEQPPTSLAAGLAAIEERIRALPAAEAEDLGWALTVGRADEVPGPPRSRPHAGAALPDPVTDPDELIQLLAILIEDARDAIAAERALAGAVRLSGLPRQQRARIAAPLLKRAQQVMRSYQPFSGSLITSDMALLAHAWAGQALPVEDDPHRERGRYDSETFAVSSAGKAVTMAGIFSARAWEAARVVEVGHGGVLLAEPETERAAIFAPALLARVREIAARRLPICAHDLDVALLRLAPVQDEQLWVELGRLTGRPVGAFSRIHQAIQLPLTFEAVSGRPSGKPLRDSQVWHQHLLASILGQVPVAENACWQLLTALSDPLADHEVLYGPSRYHLRHYDAAVAAWPLICPWQPELAAAHLLRPLSDGLISGLTPATTAIESIRHPGHPLGPVGHLALVTGLSSDAGDTRIAAADLWSAACADGRLDPALAASAVVSGVAAGALKASRIASGLEHASHSALGAYRTVEVVCAAADGFAPNYPAGMHALLELAARLAARVGAPEPPDAVRELAARRTGSRLVTTARQVVGASARTAPERGLAIEQALAAHLHQAAAAD